LRGERATKTREDRYEPKKKVKNGQKMERRESQEEKREERAIEKSCKESGRGLDEKFLIEKHRSGTSNGWC